MLTPAFFMTAQQASAVLSLLLAGRTIAQGKGKVHPGWLIAGAGAAALAVLYIWKGEEWIKQLGAKKG